jgi:chaperone modulatory protein CbpM
VLLSESVSQSDQWHFSSQDVLRLRRIWDLENKFDANPELAGMVADLLEELERLRTHIRCME